MTGSAACDVERIVNEVLAPKEGECGACGDTAEDCPRCTEPAS